MEMDTRELEMRKVQSNMENEAMYLRLRGYVIALSSQRDKGTVL